VGVCPILRQEAAVRSSELCVCKAECTADNIQYNCSIESLFNYLVLSYQYIAQPVIGFRSPTPVLCYAISYIHPELQIPSLISQCLLDPDPPQLLLRSLGHHNIENAVGQAGSDSVLVDPARELEAAMEVANGALVDPIVE